MLPHFTSSILALTLFINPIRDTIKHIRTSILGNLLHLAILPKVQVIRSHKRNHITLCAPPSILNILFLAFKQRRNTAGRAIKDVVIRKETVAVLLNVAGREKDVFSARLDGVVVVLKP